MWCCLKFCSFDDCYRYNSGFSSSYFRTFSSIQLQKHLTFSPNYEFALSIKRCSLLGSALIQEQTLHTVQHLYFLCSALGNKESFNLAGVVTIILGGQSYWISLWTVSFRFYDEPLLYAVQKKTIYQRLRSLIQTSSSWPLLSNQWYILLLPIAD